MTPHHQHQNSPHPTISFFASTMWCVFVLEAVYQLVGTWISDNLPIFLTKNCWCSWYQPHYFDILNMLKAKIRKHKSPSSIRCLRIKRTHSEVHNPPSGRSASWLWQQNSSRSQEGKKLWGQQFFRKKSCKKPSPESGSITGQLVL